MFNAAYNIETMNVETAIRGACKTLRLARRSFRGSCSANGRGKKFAHKAERRVGRALCADQ
jgi:hypothetical protein